MASFGPALNADMSLREENPEAENQGHGSRQDNRRRGRGTSHRSAHRDASSDLDDEEKVARLSSTIAAAEAERASLQKRIIEKSVVKKLEQRLSEQIEVARQTQIWAKELEQEREQLLRVQQDTEASFRQTLESLEADVRRLMDDVTTKSSETQTKDDQLVELRNENRKVSESNEAIRVEYEGKVISINVENQRLQKQVQSLLDTRDANERKIYDLQKDVERMHRMERLNMLRPQREPFSMPMDMGPGMFGPVSGPPGVYHPEAAYNEYAPSVTRGPPPPAPMGYAARPMHMRPMPYDDYHQAAFAPPPDNGLSCPPYGGPYPPYVPDCLPLSLSEPSNHQVGSDGGSLSQSSGQVPTSPGAVSISPRQMQVDGEPSEVLLEPIGLVCEPTQQASVDGPAFLAKLQKKEADLNGDNITHIETNGVPAVHEPTALAGQAPPPPVQTSRSGAAVKEADERHGNTTVAEAKSDSPLTQDASSSTSAAAEVHQAVREEPIYITPLPERGFASFTPQQQQQYKENIKNLNKPSPQTATKASDLAGHDVIPMPDGTDPTQSETSNHNDSQANAAQLDSAEANSAQPTNQPVAAQRSRGGRQNQNKRRGRGRGGRAGSGRGPQEGGTTGGASSTLRDSSVTAQTTQRQSNDRSTPAPSAVANSSASRPATNAQNTTSRNNMTQAAVRSSHASQNGPQNTAARSDSSQAAVSNGASQMARRQNSNGQSSQAAPSSGNMTQAATQQSDQILPQRQGNNRRAGRRGRRTGPVTTA